MPKTCLTPQLTMSLGHHIGDRPNVQILFFETDIHAVLPHLDGKARDHVVILLTRRWSDGSPNRATGNATSRFRSTPHPMGHPGGGTCSTMRGVFALIVGQADGLHAAGHRLDPVLGQVVEVGDLPPDQRRIASRRAQLSSEASRGSASLIVTPLHGGLPRSGSVARWLGQTSRCLRVGLPADVLWLQRWSFSMPRREYISSSAKPIPGAESMRKHPGDGKLSGPGDPGRKEAGKLSG